MLKSFWAMASSVGLCEVLKVQFKSWQLEVIKDLSSHISVQTQHFKKLLGECENLAKASGVESFVATSTTFDEKHAVDVLASESASSLHKVIPDLRQSYSAGSSTLQWVESEALCVIAQLGLDAPEARSLQQQTSLERSAFAALELNTGRSIGLALGNLACLQVAFVQSEAHRPILAARLVKQLTPVPNAPQTQQSSCFAKMRADAKVLALLQPLAESAK